MRSFIVSNGWLKKPDARPANMPAGEGEREGGIGRERKGSRGKERKGSRGREGSRETVMRLVEIEGDSRGEGEKRGRREVNRQ